MANSESDAAVRSERRRRRARIGSDEKLATQRGDIEEERRPTLDELRSLRRDTFTGGSTKRKSAAAPRMVSAAVSRSNLGTSKPGSTKHRVKGSTSHRVDLDGRPRRKRTTSLKDEDASQTYVYGPPKTKEPSSNRIISETRTLGRDNESCDSAEERTALPIITEDPERKPRSRARKVKIVYVEENERPRSSKHTSRTVVTDGGTPLKDNTKLFENPLHRSHTTSTRRSSIISPFESFKRPSSTREVKDAQPALKRSLTTSSVQRSVKPQHEPSISGTKRSTASKQAGFLGGLFATTHKEQIPPRVVECMTCLSDDIPHAKSAKLKCGHRMCHSCLKRIFRLSVKDPQHMPPKCCTTEHIPLKHVDRLFDVEFKKLWNKKFQEYTTKNRIYCPARRCGEWIKPGNIHSEGGKKFGKCGRCKTKVCILCNGKWHGNKDCPKDEETNALLEAAKQAGWQRCYSCRTMVELKEGCNHMTCRCTAEFCMLCGLKWKSCNCPWFNYDQVEADRLRHMRPPGPDRLQHMRVPEPLARFQQRPQRQPRAYNEDINHRRRQEVLDEELARRLQVLGVDDDIDNDYNGGLGDIHGIGNAGDHFMNQDYRRPAPGPNPANAAANYVMGLNRARDIPLQPPPPNVMPLRRNSVRAEQHNAAPTTRASERVVPRRARNDYASEAARHAPLMESPQRRPRVPAAAPRPSVLAGLAGAGRGSGRVGAWRAHVEPGVEPAEGVLSM